MENSILSLPPGEFLLALNELGFPDDQREFLLSQYGAPEPRPPVPDDRSFGYHLLDNLIGFDDDYVTRGEAWRAGVQDTLSEFVSPEAGQRRRAALDRVDQRINDALDYYLGPQLAPRVQQAADLGGLLSPGADVVDAYQASGDLMAPNKTPLDRAASGAALAGALGAMFMPGGVSSIRQGVEDVADAAVRAYDPATTNAFTVWHASPHDFDRFSMDRIGTGEGAQAYGHGLYFAENPAVSGPGGQYWLDFVSRVPISEDLSKALADVDDLGYSGPRAARAAILRDPQWRNAYDVSADEADRIERALPSSLPRAYEVSIDANPEDFLDWDRPLSEQPEAVRAAVERVTPPKVFARRDGTFQAYLEGPDGFPVTFDGATREEAIQKAMQGLTGAHAVKGNVPSLVSRELSEAGIPGIRYLDAGSRGAGEGSRNYVVFNDELLSILNKYGLAGGVGLASLALMGEEDSADSY